MKPDYDLIVIGGGSAGLTAAGVGVHLGARTLLVERNRLGGDCTWTGCIPSKTLLHTAALAHAARRGSSYGIDADPHVDFAGVMAHVRSTREKVYVDADHPDLIRDLGVDVRFGAARFADPHTLEIAGGDAPDRVSGSYFVICTGGSPSVPTIPGLDETEYLTSETLFEISERPRHLAILGAGPIGIEMAQAFRRLGSDVTVADTRDRILAHDEPDLGEQLRRCLESEGIRFDIGADVRRVARDGSTSIIHLADREIRADALLIATGRRPNVADLGLDHIDLAYTAKGINVDDRCRTTVPHIFAAGDVTGRYQFTHMSEHMAKTAVANALLKVPSKIDTRAVPWVTFTDPELSHVGATESELKERGASFETHRFPYDRLDRAVADGSAIGTIVVHATKWRGKILGASVLGARAGELISSYALAMRNGLSLRQISDTIHPYPTYGLGVRRAADQWYARRHTSQAVKALQRLFGYRGPVREIGPDEII